MNDSPPRHAAPPATATAAATAAATTDAAAPDAAPARLAPDADDARFIRRVAILLVIGAVVWAMIRAVHLIILAFGAMLGSIAIHGLAELYRNRLGVSARVGQNMGIVTALAIIGFLGWLFGFAFRDQVNALVTQLPMLLDQFAHTLSQSPIGAKMVSAVHAAYAGSRMASDVGGLVQGTGEIALNFIILMVGALFLAADPAVYQRGLLLLVPRSKRDIAEDALFDVASTLRLWLRAELIMMTTMGLLVGVGLWISGVPSASGLGLLAGLSEFIPYVGPTAAMLPALGLAATKGTGPVIGALVTYAVVRMIQTNFITPYVNSRVIAIPPAMTVFTIIGIGYVFGLFGLFFSAGMLVTIYTLVRSLYLREVIGEPVPKAPHDSLFAAPDSARDSR